MKINIQTDGCITIGQIAEGTFEVLDNFLFIEAKDYRGARSSITPTPKKEEFSQIRVTTPNGKPVEGVSVYLIDSLGRILWDTQVQTDEQGLAQLINDKQARKIQVADAADRSLTIDYAPEFDYHALLVTGQVLENRTMVFKIHSVDSNSLSLSWFTQNLNDKLSVNRNMKKIARLFKKRRLTNCLTPRVRVFRKINSSND